MSAPEFFSHTDTEAFPKAHATLTEGCRKEDFSAPLRTWADKFSPTRRASESIIEGEGGRDEVQAGNTFRISVVVNPTERSHVGRDVEMVVDAVTETRRNGGGPIAIVIVEGPEVLPVEVDEELLVVPRGDAQVGSCQTDIDGIHSVIMNALHTSADADGKDIIELLAYLEHKIGSLDVVRRAVLKRTCACDKQ